MSTFKTFHEKNINQNKKEWFLFDAKNQVVGRLATQISRVLIGKNKPNFTRHVDSGDFAIVINADKIKLTGKKWSDKMYYDHSGYVSGLKEKTATELHAKHPEEILRRAVWGMINKTILGREQLTKLKLYNTDSHPHSAQNPKPYVETARKVKNANKKSAK